MSAAAPSTVLWLPSHPAMGAISMDRYWQELEREREAQGVPADLRIISALGDAPQASRRGGRLERAWHKYALYPWLTGRMARRSGVQAVHVLDHSFAHLLRRVPRGVFKVATVHDLAPLHDDGELTASQRARFRQTVECLKQADLVLAVSRHSANDAIALLGLAPERTRVLPEGVRFERFNWRSDQAEPAPIWRNALAGRRIVLSVGTTIGRKNLEALPAIFRVLRDSAASIKTGLLRVGQPLPKPLREELDAVLGREHVVELGFVSEADLVGAYQNADAFLFPSRLEGFGFPVLEAMAAGCPVVCTNVTSLPEVGGSVALYFGPDEPAEAAIHLHRLFTDKSFHRERVRLGEAHAACFSWSEHYRKLLGLYRQAA